jgi:diacylglycerol kinase family enzyme
MQALEDFERKTIKPARKLFSFPASLQTEPPTRISLSMGESRRVRIFFNADSGVGGVSTADLCAAFAAHGCACEVTILRKALDWPSLAAGDPIETVWVAAGGDGTVHAVAAVCAGTQRPLAVLPVGTLNHFARDLGLPLRLEDAIQLVATGPVRSIDAAEANGILFVNNSSLGVYPAMVLDRDRMRKGGGNKWWAMVVASARAYIRFRCLHVELEVDGQSRHCKTALLFVGNNRYAKQGGRIGQRERLDEGVLSVALVAGPTRWGMLKVFAAALLGRAKQAGELEEFLITSFHVRAHGRRRLRVAFDGEVMRLPSPIAYRIRPAALRVIVPPSEMP